MAKFNKTDVKIMQINVFSIVLIVLSIISMIIPLHPKVSEAEKRELTKFPEFSIKAVANGDFFDGINDWFADTFPFRDKYVALNSWANNLFAATDTQIQGDVVQGDDIPTAPMSTDMTMLTPSATPTPAGSPTPTPIIDDVVDPDMAGVPVETLNAILVVGDAGYEYYNFSQDVSNQYIMTLNRAAEVLQGKATVYDILIPTSMDIMLPSSVRDGISSSNQKDAINYMYGSMSDSVVKVELFDLLRAHRDEYIYYRTDHHWTSLGAWYAYQAFADRRGRGSCDLNTDFTQIQFTGFLGSFYNDTGKSPALNNPDIVTAYQPVCTNHIDITQKDNTYLSWNVVTDVNGWNPNYLYNTFIGGDNPYSVIKNPLKNDGSACIIIKESFGNAFVPFLVPDYQYVYVIDYRYYATISQEKLVDLVNRTGATDVIFANNMSATRNKGLIDAITAFVN